MGAVLGLVFGLGVLLVWRSGPRKPAGRLPKSSWTHGTRERLIQAGFASAAVGQLYVLCAFSAVAAAAVVVAVSHSAVIAIAFGGFAAYAPMSVVKMRQRQRQSELRAV